MAERTRTDSRIAVALALSILGMGCGIAKASETMPLGRFTIKWKFNDSVGPVRGELALTCTNPVAFSRRLHTNDDGTVAFNAPEGTCALESASPFPHNGKVYTWDVSLEFVAGRKQTLTLSKDNAVVREGETSPSVPAPPVSVSPTATGDDELADVTDDLVLPVLVFSVEPYYPDIARRARIEGHVVVKAVVDKEGNVYGTTVVKSSNPMFEESAIEAVKQRKYKPALKAGKPVAIEFSISVDCRLL